MLQKKIFFEIIFSINCFHIFGIFFIYMYLYFYKMLIYSRDIFKESILEININIKVVYNIQYICRKKYIYTKKYTNILIEIHY